MLLNLTILLPEEVKAEHKLLPLHLNLFLISIVNAIIMNFMWVYSVSPPSLSLIGPLTTEIYYWTGITTQTDRQTG